jgi:hypothetical protein
VKRETHTQAQAWHMGPTRGAIGRMTAGGGRRGEGKAFPPQQPLKKGGRSR